MPNLPSFRRTVFNPLMGGEVGSYLSQESKSECNSATAVRNYILRFRNPTLQLLHPRDTSNFFYIIILKSIQIIFKSGRGSISKRILQSHHHYQLALTVQSSLTLLAIHPYPPSLQIGLLDCILCPYKADVTKSLLVSQHCYTSVKVHKTLLVNSSLLLHVLFVLLEWFVR